MLVAAGIAVITGRMMKEAWLPAGELNHGWYLAHLAAWLGVFISLALHVLMGAKVGGAPLLMSMFEWGIRSPDKLQFWRLDFWQQGVKKYPEGIVLKVLEGVILGLIFLAFILPIFNP
jgi:hypothetical protein